MNRSIHAQYLDIEWLEPCSVRRLTAAPEPIEIEERKDGTLFMETQIFHSLAPWVGLKLSGEFSEVEPFFKDLQGNLTPMLRIEDGEGNYWWVQNDGWDKINKRHLSALHRSAGEFTIMIGSKNLILQNLIDSLNRIAIEDYLQDFKQDLIWLVLGFGGGAAKADGMPQINQELISALKSFSNASRQVLRKPASDIKEIQINSHPGRLRANSNTFRSYLRNPIAQQFPGRGCEETVDLAENRYLRYMTQICIQLSQQITKSAQSHSKLFLSRSDMELKRASTYKNQTHRRIDPQIFDRQVQEIQEKIKQINDFSDARSRKETDTVVSIDFYPGTPYGKTKNQLFFLDKNKKNVSRTDGKHPFDYAVIKLPENLIKILNATKQYCNYYSIEYTRDIEIKKSSNEKPYCAIDITWIKSIKAATQIMKKKKERRDFLEKNQWVLPLTEGEKNEVTQEEKNALRRQEFYQQKYAQSQKMANFLTNILAELKKQERQWGEMTVLASPKLPMGMRFSQNPAYASCQEAFQRIIALTASKGFDLSLLDNIEKISVLHASALYERWCLIKIISVLIEDYSFRPEKGWQKVLIEAITGRPESIVLYFLRKDINMWARLEVQPELINGRRPDFIIQFSFDSDEFNQTVKQKKHPTHSQHVKRMNPFPPKKLVMDAKFRSQWKFGDLENMLDSLIHEKRYGNYNDAVFILHPAQNSITTPSSPLEWGYDCNYGGLHPKNHKQGTIYLAPEHSQPQQNKNLKRLIAFFLQNSFTPPFQGAEKINSFCIDCGTIHNYSDVKFLKTKIGKSYWEFLCSSCNMKSIRTHCYFCETPLFKNGLHLTCHHTVADQITNVICPSCGRYFDNPTKTEE